MDLTTSNLQRRYRELAGTVRWRLTHLKARYHRSRCNTTQFIAIVGSNGKTTTKELTAAILSTRYQVHKTRGNNNALNASGVEISLLGTNTNDDFAVLEAGLTAPDQMAKLAEIMRPHAAIMLCVRPAHIRGFGSLEAIAREKGVIFDYLQPGGIGIVNADDEYVMSEASRRTIELRTFGTDPACDICLLKADSRWPERLTLTVRINGTEHFIRTQLLGKHWASSVLAALAVGTHFGVDPESCAKAIESVPPFWGRMQPATLSNGVTFVRDEIHGDKHNFEVAFDFIGDATAKRKVLLASCYASEKTSRARMEELGRYAAALFDYAIFIGDRGNYAIRAAAESGMPRENMVAFYKYQEAVEHLRSELHDGDLVLLKGRMDTHLSRLYLSMMGDVGCTVKSCSNTFLCDGCHKVKFKPTQPVTGPIAPRGPNF